jgi:Tol biopolymer transport system component
MNPAVPPRVKEIDDEMPVRDIYVMNADGSGITRLTDSPASEMHPAWSP